MEVAPADAAVSDHHQQRDRGRTTAAPPAYHQLLLGQKIQRRQLASGRLQRSAGTDGNPLSDRWCCTGTRTLNWSSLPEAYCGMDCLLWYGLLPLPLMLTVLVLNSGGGGEWC